MNKTINMCWHELENQIQSFDLERTWWRLFQKRAARTKYDIYIFITITGCGGQFVPEVIVRSVFSASGLIRFIRNIYCRNWKFL